MAIWTWLANRFTERGRAIILFHRGKSRANKRDDAGAIEDYSAALQMPQLPADIRALALYNRALVWIASGENAQGSSDLNQILAMDVFHSNVKTMARQALMRIKATLEKKKR